MDDFHCLCRSQSARTHFAGIVLVAMVTLVLSAHCASALAYVPGKAVWTRTSGTAAQGRSFIAGAAAPNGVFYAGGSIVTSATGDTDALIVKYGPTGKVLWTRTWSGPGSQVDYVAHLATTATGEVYAAVGSGISTEVVKYTVSGKLEWVATRQGDWAYHTAPAGLVLDRAGDVLLACSSSTLDLGRSGPLPVDDSVEVTKYDGARGDQIWSSALGPDPSSYEGGYSASGLAVDSAGNAFVAANYWSGRFGSRGAVAIRFAAADGAETHAAPNYFGARGFSAVAVRGPVVAFAGSASPNDSGPTAAFVATFDTALAPRAYGLFRRSSETEEGDSACDVAIGRRGDVFIVGRVSRPRPGSRLSVRCLVARFSPGLGTAPRWAALYAPTGVMRGDASGRELVLDRVDNVYLAGNLTHPKAPMGGKAALILKYSRTGERKWANVWGDMFKGTYSASAIALGGATALYVAYGGLANGSFSRATAMRINR